MSFRSEVANFDAVISHVPSLPEEKQLPTYVGNGYIAAAFDSQNGLYIRGNRALSVPVKFYPVIESTIEGIAKEEVNVLQIRSGLAHRIQTFNSNRGCTTVKSQLYAHRSIPSLMVQELIYDNPTRSDVTVSLDQIKASGWTDSVQVTQSAVNYAGDTVSYTVTSGFVGAETSHIAVVIATTTIDSQKTIAAGRSDRQYVYTTAHYTRPGELEVVKKEVDALKGHVQEDMIKCLKIEPSTLKQQHTSLWQKFWLSGFSISYSKASRELNGDKINSTIYYVLSNVPAPLHDPRTPQSQILELHKTLHYPDQCYKDHTTLHSPTLWVDPVDEDSISRIVTTWIITLEKQGCPKMIQAGVEGVLQAMILSIGALQFGNDHLEMKLEPKDTHRDFNFHRINYGNSTHLNISVLVGEDNKANIFVALDRNDKPYYACDAGCLDPPVLLSNTKAKFPVKLTAPLTSILYITADKIHMEEYKHAIHVKEIAEAPAHEHHVIALHKHGHHFGGLPTIFWVSIAFLVIVFHLFLVKLIYNEYCQAQERFTRSRYNA